MISLYESFDDIIYEGISSEDLSKYFSISSVKEFIDLSKKAVEEGADTLTQREKARFRGLFDDPNVKEYILAARKAGERDGWLRGSVMGGLFGGIIGSISGGLAAGTAGFIIVGLMAAVAGGYATGWTWSKLLGILRKWNAEDDVVKLGKYGGRIGSTTPMVMTKEL